MDNLEKVLEELRRKGYRNTNIRISLLNIFQKSEKPLTYFDLQKLLLKKQVLANKATIYRELAFLKNQNIIMELQLKNEAKHYELTPDNHHHHLVCKNCDVISHVEIKENLNLEEEKISKSNNFKILNHSLEFYGLCQKCQ